MRIVGSLLPLKSVGYKCFCGRYSYFSIANTSDNYYKISFICWSFGLSMCAFFRSHHLLFIKRLCALFFVQYKFITMRSRSQIVHKTIHNMFVTCFRLILSCMIAYQQPTTSNRINVGRSEGYVKQRNVCCLTIEMFILSCMKLENYISNGAYDHLVKNKQNH